MGNKIYVEDPERILIGQLLLDTNYYLSVYEKLDERDFSRPRWRKAWREYKKIWISAGDVDALSLSEACEGNPGPGELLQAIEEAALYRSTDWAFRKVKNASGRRILTEGLSRILKKLESTDDPTSLYDELRELALTGRRVPGRVYSAHEMTAQMLKKQEERNERSSPIDGYRTGFPILDSHLGGLAPKRITLLSGPSGHGKTALSLQWLMNISCGENVPVLFASLEMDIWDIQDRLAAQVSSTDLRVIKAGTRSQRYLEGLTQIETSPLLVSDNEPRDIYAVTAMIEKHALRDGIKLWMLDYIGELVRDNPGFREDRDERFARWVKILRDLSKRLALHGIVVCQVNSEGQLAESKKMSHIADAWLHFYREGPRHFLECRKNRFGPSGYVYEISYDRSTQSLYEMEIMDTKAEEIS